MTITPAGLPAWSRTADHTAYGGDLNKRNYQAQGVTDPTTDIGAEHITRAAEDEAACVRVAEFAVLTVQCNDSDPAAPTIVAANLMTGVQLASYAGDNPPTGFPSAAREGDGSVTITFDQSYADAYGMESGLTIRHVVVGNQTAAPLVAGVAIDGNEVTVSMFESDSGNAAADARFTIEVAP